MIFASRALISTSAVDYYCPERADDGSVKASAWQGRGAERLGLTAGAAVERGAFLALLQGRSPFDGSDLFLPMSGVRRHCVAWNFAAAPDKSVSLVALLGPDRRVVEAHLDAAARAFEVLEQQALAHHPVHRLLPTGNLVIARFDHDSSRALDPQLHSHHLILNMTDRAAARPRSVTASQPSLGRERPPRAAPPARPLPEWRALVTRGLFAALPLASAVYQAELARGLRSLGYELGATARGQVRILGIADGAMDAFSKRRRQVLAELARHHPETPGAARFALVSTRAVMGRRPDPAALRAGWRAEAARLGVDVGRARRTADERLARRAGGARPASGEASERARAAVAWAVARLGEREDVFRAMDLEALALRRAVGGGSGLDEIRAAIAAHPDVIRRDAFPWALGELPAAALMTTDSTIRIEVENLARVRAGRLAGGAPILTRPYAGAAGAAATLTPDQLHVVRRILESRAAVLAVEGRPGPGKTAALAAVREAAHAAGWSLRGFAVTAGAMTRLRQAGIETGLLKSLAPASVSGTAGSGAPDGGAAIAGPDGRPAAPSAPPGQLWIVDEAGLLRHREAAAALDGAHRAGARLVLIGERRSYREDEAGRPWAAFQDVGLRPARLDPVRRPPDPELPRALQLAAAGRAGDAMRHLDAAGQVVEIAGARERHAAMVGELTGPAPGAGGSSSPRQLRDTLMIAPGQAERRDLNALARRDLVARGVVAPAGVAFESLVSKGLTAGQRADPRQYEVGDVVIYGKPSRLYGFRAGDTARVVAVAAEPGSHVVTVARHRDGAVVEVDPRVVFGSDLARVESRELAAGDRVQFQTADRPRSIVRGAIATVSMAAPDRLVLLLDPTVKRASPRIVVLEPGNAPLPLDHAYAVPPPVTHRRPLPTVRVLAAMDTRHGPELVNRRQTLVTLARASHRLTVFTDDRAALPGAVDRQPSLTPHDLRQTRRRDRHAAAPLSRDAARGSGRDAAGRAAGRPPAEPPGRTEGIQPGRHARGGALPVAAPARRDRARAGRGADRALRPRDPLPRRGAERSAREAARPHGAALRGRRPGDAAERDSPLRRLGAALDPGDPRAGLSAGDRARSAAPSLAEQLIAAAERWQATQAGRGPLDALGSPPPARGPLDALGSPPPARRPRSASAALSPLYRIEDPERQLVRLVERIGPARALAILPPALAQAVRSLREVARLLDGPSLGR